jgi:hypothetical protein
MRHRFVHEFDDDPPHGDFEVELDPPPGARVRFDLQGERIWLSADRAGWLHLARICAEMALHSGSRPGYHFHRSYDWRASADREKEVSFELAADTKPA